MTPHESFFESVPPEPEESEQRRVFANMPWQPPINVVPVVQLMDVDLFASALVVLRLQSISAYDRGLLITVEGWLHPDGAPRAEGPYGMQSEPRVGLLLTDGTKLGARGPGQSPDMAAASTGTPSLTMAGGESSDLRLKQDWWLQPVPAVDAELVVAWDELDIPETSIGLDLAIAREASTRARELWPLPDVDDGDYGWFAYSPTSGAAYAPGLDLNSHESP